MRQVQVLKLDDDVFVIKKVNGSGFFVTTSDSVVISQFNFFALLKFMLYRGFISPKVLEGLLSEFSDTKEV